MRAGLAAAARLRIERAPSLPEAWTAAARSGGQSEDDLVDPVNRALARTPLEKNGFRVAEAADGVVALEQLDGTADFSLMILDLDMPRLGGADVLAHVRKSLATVGLPVIVLTGSTSGDNEAEMMDRGADDYVRKPIDPPRFVARVKAALRRAGM